MAYAVKLRTDLGVSLVERGNDSLLDSCYKHIGCSMIEIVRPKGLKHPYVMVIDEEGLLKACPVINFVGSYLYGTQKHKNPIVGNALILKEVDTYDGPDLSFLEYDEASEIAKKMVELSGAAFNAVRDSLEKAGILTSIEVRT